MQDFQFLDLTGVCEDDRQQLLALFTCENPAVVVLAPDAPLGARKCGVVEESIQTSPIATPPPLALQVKDDEEDDDSLAHEQIPSNVPQEELAGPGTFLPDGGYADDGKVSVMAGSTPPPPPPPHATCVTSTTIASTTTTTVAITTSGACADVVSVRGFTVPPPSVAGQGQLGVQQGGQQTGPQVYQPYPSTSPNNPPPPYNPLMPPPSHPQLPPSNVYTQIPPPPVLPHGATVYVANCHVNVSSSPYSGTQAQVPVLASTPGPSQSPPAPAIVPSIPILQEQAAVHIPPIKPVHEGKPEYENRRFDQFRPNPRGRGRGRGRGKRINAERSSSVSSEHSGYGGDKHYTESVGPGPYVHGQFVYPNAYPLRGGGYPPYPNVPAAQTVQGLPLMYSQPQYSQYVYQAHGPGHLVPYQQAGPPGAQHPAALQHMHQHPHQLPHQPPHHQQPPHHHQQQHPQHHYHHHPEPQHMQHPASQDHQYHVQPQQPHQQQQTNFQEPPEITSSGDSHSNQPFVSASQTASPQFENANSMGVQAPAVNLTPSVTVPPEGGRTSPLTTQTAAMALEDSVEPAISPSGTPTSIQEVHISEEPVCVQHVSDESSGNAPILVDKHQGNIQPVIIPQVQPHIPQAHSQVPSQAKSNLPSQGQPQVPSQVQSCVPPPGQQQVPPSVHIHMTTQGQPSPPQLQGPPQVQSQLPPQGPPQGPPQAPMQAPPQVPLQAPLQAPPQVPLQGPPQTPPQGLPQVPLQAPPQVSPQGPPQVPLQAPPQVPLQAPPQVPLQAPPQVPLQAPPQVPLQAPPQGPPQLPLQAPSQAPLQAPPQVPLQAPPQGPPQVPLQAPPQVPLQAPPQAPLQAPPQAPLQAPPQAPLQAPSQVPLQAPPQVPPQGQPQVPPQGQPQMVPQSQPQMVPQSQPQMVPQSQPQVVPQSQPQVPLPGLPQMPQIQGQPQMQPKVSPQGQLKAQTVMPSQGQPQSPSQVSPQPVVVINSQLVANQSIKNKKVNQSAINPSMNQPSVCQSRVFFHQLKGKIDHKSAVSIAGEHSVLSDITFMSDEIQPNVDPEEAVEFASIPTPTLINSPLVTKDILPCNVPFTVMSSNSTDCAMPRKNSISMVPAQSLPDAGIVSIVNDSGVAVPIISSPSLPSPALSEVRKPEVVVPQVVANSVPGGAWAQKKSWSQLFKPCDEGAAKQVAYVAPFNQEAEKPLEEIPSPMEALEHKMPDPPLAEADLDKAKIGAMLREYIQDHHHVALQPRGLINKGYWCYVNAPLQALLACPPFYNLMRNIPNISGLKKGKSSTPVIDSIVEYIHEFSDMAPMLKPCKKDKANAAARKEPDIVTGTAFEPLYVYKMLATMNGDMFTDGRQQDAEEMLSFVLNGLHEEMVEALKLAGEVNPPPPSSDNSVNGSINGENIASDNEEMSDDEWQVMGPRKRCIVTRTATFSPSPISAIFWGQLRSVLHQASGHGQTTANLQPFTTLPLDIQSSKVESVRDALEQLVRSEEIPDYTDSKTNQDVVVFKQVFLEHLPNVLILQLKRFIYDVDGGLQKVMKKVNFPIDLEITKELMSTNSRGKFSALQRKYKLLAVVYHDGKEANKGHYVADIYHGGYNCWLRYDDSCVKVVQDTSVIRHVPPRVPYLLFYRRGDTMVGPSTKSKS
ncbi:uncharacterized protein [Procambarus clarkii]|uniref:uncharacterized protein isoform X1 n=1 Tax=Procambarus clarkii TaxID=6728 RepID=UPI003742C24F